MDIILSSFEIKAWDSYTIIHEPIESIALMERAATKCTQWLQTRYQHPQSFAIFCGNGNNGGDGLAIARQLLTEGYQVQVYCEEESNKTPDNRTNLKELQFLFASCINSISNPWTLSEDAIIIDAIFGIGLDRPIEGKEKYWIEAINDLPNKKISIDIPSGLAADLDLQTSCIIKADYTLSFQCYKKTFLFAETGIFCGKIILLDIGLDPEYLSGIKHSKVIINKQLLKTFYKERSAFSHKGTYGHVLLCAGSRGKMGAAILAAQACMRSGAGLVSVLVPDKENMIVQISVPEAMTIPYDLQFTPTNFDNYNAIGVGCGLGQSELSKHVLTQLLTLVNRPIVLDADALNILSNNKNLLNLVPKGSILTPHVKEFDRLFGASANSNQRYELQKQKSRELEIVILLKGKNTCITTPGGASYFNITGNAGMATGGTGDVLTGLITGLNAQYQDSLKAALIGVYIHGLSGDFAIESKESQESLVASDLNKYFGKAFRTLQADKA